MEQGRSIHTKMTLLFWNLKLNYIRIFVDSVNTQLGMYLIVLLYVIEKYYTTKNKKFVIYEKRVKRNPPWKIGGSKQRSSTLILKTFTLASAL